MAGVRVLSGKLKKTVVLVGMMGAGKTAVGNAVARHLGVPFLDSDEEIERAFYGDITAEEAANLAFQRTEEYFLLGITAAKQ